VIALIQVWSKKLQQSLWRNVTNTSSCFCLCGTGEGYS